MIVCRSIYSTKKKGISMKKYLALALLISFAGVHAMDDSSGDGSTPIPVSPARSSTPSVGSQKKAEHPQTWSDLLRMPNPKYMVAAGASGYCFWRFVRGNTDTTFLTKEAMEAAAVAALAYGSVRKAEVFLLDIAEQEGSILDRKDWKGTAAKVGAGATVGALAAWRDINPLSGDINPVGLAMGVLGK